MHFAAFALVGESVSQPHLYYGNNVAGLVPPAGGDAGGRRAARSCFPARRPPTARPRRCRSPRRRRSSRSTPTASPSWWSSGCSTTTRTPTAWRSPPCATSTPPARPPKADLGEDHDPESHLIPIVLQVALGQRDKIMIFGDDYPTPDGTCIRDYVHVDDLASAHLAALERLQPGQGIKVQPGHRPRLQRARK